MPGWSWTRAASFSTAAAASSVTATTGRPLLRLRDPSDYQVIVLEVVGTDDLARIGEIEALWKRKLLSRDIGLNLN